MLLFCRVYVLHSDNVSLYLTSPKNTLSKKRVSREVHGFTAILILIILRCIATQFISEIASGESTMLKATRISKKKQNLSEEVIDIIRNAQEATQKFHSEVHGELSNEVYSLVTLLHEARMKAENINKKMV
jgi:hypothetical protein